MTPEIALTLGIIVVAVVLFATEKLRVDLIALLVLLTVALTGLVTFEQAISGFSSPAVITVWAVYIVSAGLFRTGVADVIGQRIIRLAGKSEPRLIAVIMLTCGTMSAFMNNIGATATLLPAVVSIARQAKVPLSRLLIPLAFSSLLGGNLTLIGTPPNVLAASILAERGLSTFGFFDFAPTGLIVFGVGVAYMVLFGRHLLPARESADGRLKTKVREYVSEVRVTAASPLAGQTLLEARLGADYDLSVLGLVREDALRTGLHRDTRLQAGDLLLVEGSVENLMQARDTLGLALEAERKFDWAQLDEDDAHVVEATLAPRSPMVGRTLREMRFRDRYNFTALAIWRQGEVLTDRLGDIRLRFGDGLLLQGPRSRLPALQEGAEFLVLEPVLVEQRRRRKAPLAVGILALALALVIVFEFPIAGALLIGSVLMVLSGVLNMDDAYQSIEWRSVFLIAGMLPLGLAMETTGTARFLADTIVGGLGGFGPIVVLAGVYILASLITEPMSNAAATVLIVPIAIDIALELGASPQSFVLATVIGASTSFLTPVGHQANVLVYGPGGYRFFDYPRVGAPLNVLLFVVTLIAVPLIWPLY